MKTKILNRLALIVLAFVAIIITSSKPAHAAECKIKLTEHANVKNIQKLIISGNVEVFLTQGNSENLKVYDDYNSKNALVKFENGVLRIASYDKQKLSVWITVKNLAEIVATGKSTIRSTNKLSSVDLSVNLNDIANAKLDAQVFNLKTSIDDYSKLQLNGEAENHQLNLSNASIYESTGFTAQNSSIIIKDKAEASFQQHGKVTSIRSANSMSSGKRFSFDPFF